MNKDDGISKIVDLLKEQQKALDYLRTEQINNQKRFDEAKSDSDKKHGTVLKKVFDVEERVVILENRIERLGIKASDIGDKVDELGKSGRRIEKQQKKLGKEVHEAIRFFDQEVIKLDKRTTRIEDHTHLPRFEAN